MRKITILIIILIITTCNFAYPQGEMIFEAEKKELRGRHIRDLVEDKSGNIWLITTPGGTKAGEGLLCMYTAKGDWYYFKDHKKIYGQKFTHLGLENNNIMACYHKKGVCIFDGTSWKNLTFKTIIEEYNIPKKEKIYEILRDTLNRTWVETNKGLLLCENNNYKRYLENIDFEGRWTYLSNGHVYAENGIYRFIEDEFVKIIETDFENFRFKGTDNLGRNWYTMTFKKDGDLYFTVSYYVNNTWKDFDFDLPYGNSFRTPELYFRPDSSIWIHSGDFIGSMKNDVLTELLFDGKEIKNSHVYDKLIFDNSNNLYVACNNRKNVYRRSIVGSLVSGMSRGGFLIKYNGNDFHYYLGDDKVAKSKQTFINDMLVDSKGNIWLSTGDSAKARAAGKTSLIIKLTPDNDFEIFDIGGGFGQNVYTFIFEDSQNRIWIGSSWNGISMYEYDN